MKLQAKDLRIGNWVTQPNRIDQITEIWQEAVRLDGYKNGYDYKYTEPIPLTEEWLIKFGFLKIDDDEWVLRDLNISRNVLRDVFVWHPYIDIKYVHQLQNLYHAITGQEL